MKKVYDLLKAIEDNIEQATFETDNGKEDYQPVIRLQYIVDEMEQLKTDEYHEQHSCSDCGETVYGNGEVILLKDNRTPCLECYNKNKNNSITK